MVVTSRWLMAALFLYGVLFARLSPAAEASLDRDTVGFGESFVLTIDAKTGDDPDLTPLTADFDVAGTSKRSQISIINGRFKKSSSWQINLVAKREGDLVIPPLKVGNEQTAALAVHVNPAASAGKTVGKDLFIEVEVTPRNPYVQAQCLYTLRVLADSSRDVDEPNLGDPKPDAGAAIIKKLGKDKITRTTRDGRHYDVLERVYAIYPQRDGDITIPPVIFQGQVSRNGGLLLDPFSGAMNLRRLQSEAVTLHVKPMPAAFTSKSWLPARSLQIHETWSDDPDDIKAGEPVTRTLSMLASGLTAAQLPDLGGSAIAGLKTYADQPLLDDQIHPDGITGLRQQKIAVIADAGDVTLPEIHIPWWNTETDRVEDVVLPARKLHVSAAVAATNPQSEAAPSILTQPRLANGNIPHPTSTSISQQPASLWLSLGLGLGWLLTVLYWWWSAVRQRNMNAKIIHARRQKEGHLLKTVLDACAADTPARARAALLAWTRARWPDHPPQGLTEVAVREPALAGPLDELNQVLYSRAGRQWRGGALATALKNLGNVKNTKPSTAPTPALEPLFRV